MSNLRLCETDREEVISEKHRAPSSCREMFQWTLKVFLVNSRHNDSSVPPTEFQLSTPTVVILKSVESAFLLFFSAVCLHSFLSLPPPSPSFYCEDHRDSLTVIFPFKSYVFCYVTSRDYLLLVDVH